MKTNFPELKCKRLQAQTGNTHEEEKQVQEDTVNK